MLARVTTVLLGVVLLLAATLFTVPDDESVLRLRGAAVVERDLAPGLHARVPLLERIVRIRSRGYATRVTGVDITGSDGRSASVEADVRWGVIDAAAFVRQLDADAEATGRRLQGDVAAAIRATCASRTLVELIGAHSPQLLAQALAALNARVRELGISVSGIALQRVDLKDAAAQLVQQAMRQGFEAQLVNGFKFFNISVYQSLAAVFICRTLSDCHRSNIGIRSPKYQALNDLLITYQVSQTHSRGKLFRKGIHI